MRVYLAIAVGVAFLGVLAYALVAGAVEVVRGVAADGASGAWAVTLLVLVGVVSARFGRTRT